MPSFLSAVEKDRPKRLASSFRPLSRSVSMPVLMACIGLGLFLLITRSKWGKEHREFYYLIMLLALITVAGVLWLLSQLLGFPLTN